MIDPNFENALRSDSPAPALRKIAERMLARGTVRSEVVAEFERVRQALREADREYCEDLVSDVMDFLVGWCSPNLYIPDPKIQP